MASRRKKRRRKGGAEEPRRSEPEGEAHASAESAPEELASVPWLTPGRVALLAGMVALIVYLPRLHRTLSLQGDSAVFVSTSAMWGVPQPSGYPLYTLVGFLFSKLPFGEVPLRLHLLSALCHAATVLVVARSIALFTPSRLAMFSGALCLAFARAFFQGSLYAEVFPLNDLFTAVVLFLALRFRLSRDQPTREETLFALALAIGLASAHHQMIVLTAPALALLLFWGWMRDSALPLLVGGRFVRLLGLFLAPLLLLYLTTAVASSRQPLSSWGDVHDLRSLFALATRQDYGGLFSPHLDKAQIEAGDVVSAHLASIPRHFGWAPVAAMICGAAALVLASRARREEHATTSVPLLALGLAWLFAGPIFAVVNRIDPTHEHGLAYSDRFSTMSLVPLGILAGLGIAWACERLSTMFPKPLVRALTGLVFVWPLVEHARDVDLHDDRMGIQLAHDLLADAPDGALVLLSGDHANGIGLWMCGVEKRCGSRVVMSPGQMHLAWRVQQLRVRYPDLIIPPPTGHIERKGQPLDIVTTRDLVSANLAKRPILISAEILDHEPALREAFQFIPEGLLVRVLPDEKALDAHKPRLLVRARELAAGLRCEGCGITFDALHHPSLETAIPRAYALTLENHARVVRAWFPDQPSLASQLEERALAADPLFVRKLRGIAP